MCYFQGASGAPVREAGKRCGRWMCTQPPKGQQAAKPAPAKPQQAAKRQPPNQSSVLPPRPPQ